MCFGTTATQKTVAPGFTVEEGCGGFYLSKVEEGGQNTLGWFETREEAIDASHNPSKLKG